MLTPAELRRLYRLARLKQALDAVAHGFFDPADLQLEMKLLRMIEQAGNAGDGEGRCPCCGQSSTQTESQGTSPESDARTEP